MKKLLLLIMILSGLQMYSQPRDTTTLLAITFEVDYGGSEPYVYYWAIADTASIAHACPLYVTFDYDFFKRFVLDETRTTKDTLGVGYYDINGIEKSAFYHLEGYMDSMINAIDRHRLLVQKQKVRNEFGYSKVGPLKYKTKVYLTPIRGVFGQFTKIDDKYITQVYYPASEIRYDDMFWRRSGSEGYKWPNYLRIPFMVLSGCETNPDFSFGRIYFKGRID